MAKYPRGGNLNKVPVASTVPALDIKSLLGVDSSNPFLRDLRIQQGVLDKTTIPAEFAGKIAPKALIEEEKQ